MKLFTKTVKLFIILSLCVINLNAQDSLTFDIAKTPFSYYGSYMSISSRTGNYLQNQAGLYMYEVSGNFRWPHEKFNGIFKIIPLKNGKELSYQTKATPYKITLTTTEGTCEICFENKNTLRFRCNNIDMNIRELQPKGDYNFNYSNGHWLTPNYAISNINANAQKTVNEKNFSTYNFTTQTTPVYEFAIEFLEGGWERRAYTKAFDECVAATQTELEQWYTQYPKINAEFESTRKLALYNNWSCVVAPRGNMSQHGMYMSKNWMCAVWSWDNCFNAIATGYANPNLAWQQIQLMFDHQNEVGIFPDAITDYDNFWISVKPPIYGIVLDNLISRNVVDTAKLPLIYERITRLTNFWFNCRDLNNNGIPEYFHGNDSGWDNSTMFDTGFPAESPDLCSFLICQLDFLSNLALRLNKKQEAEIWKSKSDKIANYLISELWIDEHFVSKNILTGKYNAQSQSLISYIPIIIGTKLPAEIKTKVIKELAEKGNLTQYGLATENPKSSLYEPDGYWRGPIWAPSTYLIIKGLEKCNEKKLAAEIALKFCNLCKQSGFAENFDATTGKSLRDPAYTWTSSVFLTLGFEYVK